MAQQGFRFSYQATIMDKHYHPQTVEALCQTIWRNTQAALQAFDPTRPTFSIPLPPPNVTGSLHLGHAFQLTLTDVLVRYHKMSGYNVHWQGGTDHAGIATQLVVEQQLREQGIQKTDLNPKAFLDAIWAWTQSSGQAIFQQMKRLGVTLDTSRSRFTLDAAYSEAVQKAFLALYDAGLIYRQVRLINWDTALQTALSDLEVKSETRSGHLWYIRYPMFNPRSDQPEALIVATTRPETLFGDVAVAVHPEDTRYQSAIGSYLTLPLLNKKIPVIADATVSPEFGTGAVKVTPAHDFNDAKRSKAHQLPFIQIFDQRAQLLEKAEYFDTTGIALPEYNFALPEAFQGLDRFAAREKVIQMLADQSLLVKVEPHITEVAVGERSGSIIEPRLTQQWFLNVQTMAKSAISAVESGEITFSPKMYEKQYFKWLEAIEDWCISRQLSWGHPIPAWHDAEGRIYVGKDENSVREKYQLSSDIVLTPDGDVLDTWFSSGLWTFASLGWPQSTEALVRYHPNSVVITGFDIIFYWIARMVMLTLNLPNGPKQIPFRHIYMTGLVRDETGQKMSKSRGNVLDPIDMIDGIDQDRLVQKRTKHLLKPKLQERVAQSTRQAFPNGISPHGADAMRLTLSALAVQGRDIHWDMKRLNGYRNFCDKLWNAGRFVFTQLQDAQLQQLSTQALAELIDEIDQFPLHQWMQAVLNDFLKEYQSHIQSFRFDLATQQLHHLIWQQFCDWYIEYTKPLLTAEDGKTRLKIRVSLWWHFEQLLRICHPTMPFLSEYLWQQLKALCPGWMSYPDSLVLTRFPSPKVDGKCTARILEDMERIKALVTAVRVFRAEYELAPKLPLVCYLEQSLDPHSSFQFEKLLPLALHQANLSACHLVSCAPTEVSELQNGLKWFKLPVLHDQNLYTQVPVKALLGYRNKQLEKVTALEQKLAALGNRINDPVFLARAPQSVIQQYREQAKAYRQNIAQIKASLEMIEAI